MQTTADEINVKLSVDSAKGPSKKIVAATVAGNALEFYDFLSYAFFAVYIGKSFFPTSVPMVSLLLSLAVFGVGFVTRPIGGILIGAYADRAGRKSAMVLTIVLITVGTMGLALTPSYESIGFAAPVIVVICRLLQGFALGGEVGPSTTYLVEIAPENKRGFYASWQMASQGIGVLIAGGLGVILTYFLTPGQMQSWGWRLPFIIGLLLIPIAMFLRKNMPETLIDNDIELKKDTTPKLQIKYCYKSIYLAVIIIMGGTISTYIGNYMTTYAIHTLKMPAIVGMTAPVITGTTVMIFSLVGGWLSDRVGRKPVIIIPKILLIILVYPVFLYLSTHATLSGLIFASAFLAIMTSISSAVTYCAIPELFPGKYRALGLSTAYSFSVTVFGGTTQFVITWLIEATGSATSPAWYLMFAVVASLIAVMFIPETQKEKLKG